MKLNEIYQMADELAPKRLSDEACEKYGYYDNSGVLVDADEEIKGILFSLDFSFSAIEKAMKKGANLLITHHPAVYGGIGEKLSPETPLGKKLMKCVKNGISVISMHLNLDFAQGGIDESLMTGISIAADKTEGAGTSLLSDDLKTPTIMHALSIGGYGRIYNVKKTTLATLTENIKAEFESDRTLFYGNEEKEIGRVASFCGAGADENAISFAKQNAADVIVSSDFKHHVLAAAQEEGISLIVLTHYASEHYGFKKYYKKICQRVKVPCIYHTDENLL